MNKIFPVMRVVTAFATIVATHGMAHADWAQSAKPMVVAPAPTSNRAQPQNPPMFTWAKHSTSPASYVIEVRNGTTVVRTYTSARTWYLPATALPVGIYTWRVRPANTTLWSSDRSFIVANNAIKFEVPEDAVLLQKLATTPRPRSLQRGLPLYANWPAALRAERGAYVTRLVNDVVDKAATLAPLSDAAWPLRMGAVQTVASVAQNADIRNKIDVTTRQLESAVLLFRLTGETRYLTESLRRGDELAALDPAGGTSYVNQDQATRAIALSLMKSIDQLAGDLDATRRAKWLNVVAVRGEEMYINLSRNGEYLDQNPLDAHAVNAIGFLALTSVLAVGDLPQARKWFEFSFRFHVASTSPWSGPEGGFGNGTAYAEYTVIYLLPIWQAIQQATGVNMFMKPWSTGFMNYIMQFVPPGSKTYVFGDAHETKPEIKFLKAFASRIATPQAAWYSRNITNSEPPLTYLQGPYPMPADTIAVPVPPSNSALFETIGWTAFHSNMADANRTSVFFKSSPYGSFNHSHGDQNAFVLKKGGTALLSESGWYDWYASPNWNDWYRQTKAHNAITFDGGIGQDISGYENTYIRNGRILAYTSSGDIDFVTGDATAAYGGTLSKALRRLWYLRKSDAVVIHDELASPVDRIFEWNMHTLAPITVSNANVASVTKDGYSVCVRPVLTNGLKFEKRPGGLVMAGNYEEHGTYLKTAKAKTAEFLTVLDVGCKNPTIQLTTTAAGRTLKVGNDTFAIPR